MSSGASTQEHRTRRSLLTYIDAHPGVSVKELMSVLDISEGTIRYHMAHMERAGRVFSRTEGGGRRYYAEEGQGGKKDADGARAVLDIIKKNPGITTSELERRTHLSRRNLNYHLKRLREKEAIQAVRYGRQWGFDHMTPERLRKEALRKLIMKFIKGEIDEGLLLKLKDELEQT